MKKIKNLLSQFNINGEIISCTTFTNGHINSTFKVEVLTNDKIEKYVLQKINTYVFNNPNKVMDNIFNVTCHIKNKLKKCGKYNKRKVLSFFKTIDNKEFTTDSDNSCWRLNKFIDNSTTFNETNDLNILEETGKAFGSFQQLLTDFPIEKLHIIIPHFHNTVNRYQLFKESIQNNLSNRAGFVQSEIEEFLKLEDVATKMYKMQKQGLLRLRVTHNDTKCNNVMFDCNTGEYLCVIDLDTVMPGLVGFDFGDAIRFCANTSTEDETDLTKVGVDFNKFEAFTRGFLAKTKKSLTDKEKSTLALGAITMTIECGLRFLTDYIDGDKYFKTNHAHHNLDRARCQLALANDMLKNFDKMNAIVKKHSQQLENI